MALALATVFLSLFFRGSILRDLRVPTLRRLALIWSAQNILLAAGVYNRMFIYVGYNGMTRLRIVAMFGIAAVVIGFVLVVWKIVRNRSFGWLLQRHLWTPALATLLFALLPIDAMVVNYNVRQIMAGDPKPAVQILHHSIDSQGVLYLLPLLDCSNETIREGVAAMLAERERIEEGQANPRYFAGWTAFQLADKRLVEGLRANRSKWQQYTDDYDRGQALKQFRDYAYEWF